VGQTEQGVKKEKRRQKRKKILYKKERAKGEKMLRFLRSSGKIDLKIL
jgi:hypothetical protein